MLRRFAPWLAGMILLLAAAGGALWWFLADRSFVAVNAPPPRITAAAELPRETSTITVPLSGDLGLLEAGLNRRVPARLWQIDRQEKKCIPGQRVTVCVSRNSKTGKCRFGFERAKLTPDVSCRIVGNVVRGPIRLSGSGDTLQLVMPVRATIQARDVGGIIKQETATGAANVRARVRLSVTRDWRPAAKVDIAYDWTNPPGIDFLGRRIRFVDKADAKLAGVIRQLERELPAELAKIHLRPQLEGLWLQGFTSIELNREKPPAWMRLTPQRLGFGGYRVHGRRLEMLLSAQAFTETFVGNRPPDPTPTPLPPAEGRIGAQGLHFYIPVLADYAQLEPVVERALKKRAAKGIVLKDIGAIDAEFGKVTIYASDGGRIAVGIEASADARNTPFGAARGTVWLTGVPYNAPGSQLVRVRDLWISGGTDSRAVNLLVRLFADAEVVATITEALKQDFARDYERVLAKARKAIAERREGDFVLTAQIAKVTNGEIRVTGEGLFLPVRAEGTAMIRYAPQR